jgi:hypothetical protein
MAECSFNTIISGIEYPALWGASASQGVLLYFAHWLVSLRSLMAMMLFCSKREEQADCHYRYSYNRPHRLLISKTRVVSNTDDIGPK